MRLLRKYITLDLQSKYTIYTNKHGQMNIGTSKHCNEGQPPAKTISVDLFGLRPWLLVKE